MLLVGQLFCFLYKPSSPRPGCSVNPFCKAERSEGTKRLKRKTGLTLKRASAFAFLKEILQF